MASDKHIIKERNVDGAIIRFTGHIDGDTLPIDELSREFLENGVLRDCTLEDSARNLSGNFAFAIRDSEGQTLAVVDKIRSYPMFYQQLEGRMSVGFLPEDVSEPGSANLNGDAVREFAMTGYVTGNETLRQGVSQIRAGEMLVSRSGQVTVSSYYEFDDDTDDC